jgi:hypothetical protein
MNRTKQYRMGWFRQFGSGHSPDYSHLQDELPRDRGHRAPGRRRLSLPRLREHPQGLTKGPSDVLDHATSEIASGSKLGIDATKKIPGEGFKRPWPPMIRMDETSGRRWAPCSEENCETESAFRIECQLFPEGRLDAIRQARTLSGMDLGKNKSSGSSEAAKKGPPLGLVVALAAAGGVVIGSAGTYFLTKPLAAPTESASPAAGGMPQAQSATVPTMPPQQQFTPAPQPPGAPPPGKVWSVEHGHWHDAPIAVANPAPVPATPGTPVPVTPTVTPAPTTPAPVAAPAEKKD